MLNPLKKFNLKFDKAEEQKDSARGGDDLVQIEDKNEGQGSEGDDENLLTFDESINQENE